VVWKIWVVSGDEVVVWKTGEDVVVAVNLGTDVVWNTGDDVVLINLGIDVVVWKI